MPKSKQQSQRRQPEQRTHGQPAEQSPELKSPPPPQPSVFDEGHPGQCPKEKTEDVFE